jgi:hypothetical protein
MATVAVFLVRLGLAWILVPFWQGPDEPQHMYLVALIAATQTPAAAEEDIVSSMYRNGWWEYYQQSRPPQVPKTFAEGPAHVTDVTGAPSGPRTYHTFAASLLRFTGAQTIERQYVVLRAFSSLLGLLTLLMLWSANRRLFGADVGVATAFVLALHPQFLLFSLNVGPDPSVVLLGAVVWLCASHVLAGGTVSLLAVAWVAAALATTIRRVGAALIVDVAVVSAMAVLLGFAARRRPLQVIIVLSTVSAAAAAGAYALIRRFPEFAATLLHYVTSAFQPAIALEVARQDPQFVMRLASTVFLSFWLVAGWMRFEAPLVWYVSVLVLCGAAAAGVIRDWLRAGFAGRVITLTAVMFVAISLAGIFFAYVPIRTGAQGRYLFPVAGPIVGLLALGLLALFGARRAQALISICAAFLLIDATAWLFVLLPTYGER